MLLIWWNLVSGSWLFEKFSAGSISAKVLSLFLLNCEAALAWKKKDKSAPLLPLNSTFASAFHFSLLKRLLTDFCLSIRYLMEHPLDTQAKSFLFNTLLFLTKRDHFTSSRTNNNFGSFHDYFFLGVHRKNGGRGHVQYKQVASK